MTEKLGVEDVQAIGMLIDRTGIDAAEGTALAADDGKPRGWSWGLKVFCELLRAQYLLMTADSERCEQCAPMVYVCEDRAHFLAAFLESRKGIAEGTPVMWVCNGNDDTNKMLGELLGRELGDIDNVSTPPPGFDFNRDSGVLR
jgi:hypothetical protein